MQTKMPEKCAKSSSHDKLSMKSIEKDLHDIKVDFEKNHDAHAAHKKLDAIPSQIKRVVAEMKKK